MRRHIAALFATSMLLAACDAPNAPAAGKRRVTMFAAASTTAAIEEAARRFEAQTGIEVACSFDASSTLARQIIAGAPADVFLSAHQQWMNEVEAKGAVLPGSRRDLLANELVVIAPRGSTVEVEFAAEFRFLARNPAVRRIALGDPRHVPGGQYAQQALAALGWWDDVSGLVVPTIDVRSALRLVEIGEADLGIVYATDARHAEGVEIVATIPQDLHTPISYPIALCADAPAAAEFLAFLFSDEMHTVFEDAGFRVVEWTAGKDH